MMGKTWVVLIVALAGSHFGECLPVGPPQTYPHDASASTTHNEWGSDNGLYTVIPALALLVTAVGLVFGCTWCYRHKDCKLFTASATQLHDARRSQPPDSGFSEPANNNISEDNNNGPISLREMQNIANNNAAAYIVSENEERNRVSRESVVEFEPLPSGIRVADPLERCADWFDGNDFSRNRLQYLREFARGWFGRVVEGEVEDGVATTSVAVKILNQNATLEDKARFLDEARVYRDVRHENILGFVAKSLQEDPWILIFEFCSMDLRQYLIANRPNMSSLNDAGVPLRLLCDVSSALAYLHSRGYCAATGAVCSDNVLVRETAEGARGVLGAYVLRDADVGDAPPDAALQIYTSSGDVWSLGTLIWEVCAWGEAPPSARPAPPPPALPRAPHQDHLYQVMQLCWTAESSSRPSAAQVLALLRHLQASPTHTEIHFEERWQRLKPNTIPKLDEHIAIVHAPSTSMTSHFTMSEEENATTTNDTLSIDMDTAVSRSSSIMSDKDPLSTQIKSESLTNLHGSLEDVRNIYLTHNETAALECHQGNMALEERDNSDSSMDPWLKDIIAGSQDDVSYYRDVSDVIKNLDNILNSEKTSSSESSHQASPSRDNLSLDCKKEYPVQSSLVKSPGINNFQNILEMGVIDDDSEIVEVIKEEPCGEDDVDRDTIGTLSHSFERHSDSISQQTLENLTPDTPIKDIDLICDTEDQTEAVKDHGDILVDKREAAESLQNTELPKENKIESSDSIPKLKELCIASISSVSETNEQLNVREDCEVPCDNNLTEIVRTDTEVKTKSIDNTLNQNTEEINTKPNCPNERKVLKEIFDGIELLDNVEPKCVEQKSTIVLLPKVANEVYASDVNTDIPVTNESLSNLVQYREVSATKDESKEKDLKSIESLATIEVDNASIPVTNIDEVKIEILDFPKTETDMVLENAFAVTSDCLLTSEDRITVEENTVPFSDFSEETKLGSSKMSEAVEKTENDVNTLHVLSTQTPDTVQSIVDTESHIGIENTEMITPALTLPPVTVQNKTVENLVCISSIPPSDESVEVTGNESEDTLRSENNKLTDQLELNDSTAYMDLINDTNSEIVKDSTVIDKQVQDVIQSCMDEPINTDSHFSLDRNESTVYLDLPSMVKETDDFLHSERTIYGHHEETKENVCTSTPKGSDSSADNTLEKSVTKEVAAHEVTLLDVGVTQIKAEHKYVQDNLSPFDSPTKSHLTDTYDENSSVVLGPFENYAVDYKNKSELIDLPKEELLAFSSNFSEINLETPSPLRDGNFLNEVPDIACDDLQFDDATNELKHEKNEQTDNTDESDQSGTAKHISPSTPPNSPGIFLASTSHQKYLVDIDLEPQCEVSYPPIDVDSGLSSLQKEIDLNQIELHITKLAMADNENNMNVEYSGPLTVEGLVSEDEVILRDSEPVLESYLSGNGGSVEDMRQISLDEECVKALRNELELKLPLAQVASIEPAVEGEWSELPPPPELVVNYCRGALSPIAEETRHQISAYENDAWVESTRTDSSESYPEPCNNSTDEVTSLPTAAPTDHSNHSTYTLPSREHSGNDTYTLHKEVPSSKELTMSADSLNGSPYKKPAQTMSPIDDKTYTKNDDEKESNCERISQVSPFLLSPTTDTSAQADSDVNPTGVSTLSKTTVPTDAKISKPSECLSKATSIDSWCSNDTLYNVEENFDDLVMDSDVPEFEHDKDDKSESTDTLHNDDDKEHSHCSTYIVHDSKSEQCETFSPDSITANQYTYTKAKTETAIAEAKSEVNDSPVNTQTKDLAYGTLPSYSNCTTELISAIDEHFKLPQPELMRRSPILNDITMTPPRLIDDNDKVQYESPQTDQAVVKKMDSVDMTCLQDEIFSSDNNVEVSEVPELSDNSPKTNYSRDMAPSITSTPITEPVLDDESFEPVTRDIPLINVETSDCLESIPNFQSFQQSAEIRPQEPPNASKEQTDTEILLEGDSNTLSRNSNRDSMMISDRTLTYSDFENSAVNKPQDVPNTSQSMESGMSSGDFRQFENSVRNLPQDLSSLMDASSILLRNERKSADMAVVDVETQPQTEQSSEGNIRTNDNNVLQSLDLGSPIVNFKESHELASVCDTVNYFVTDLDLEDETEQPHSIIITEISKDTPVSFKSFPNSSPKPAMNAVTETADVTKDSPNKTYDSHEGDNLDHTYDSHVNGREPNQINSPEEIQNEVKVNGIHTNGEKPDVLLETIIVEESLIKTNTSPSSIHNYSKSTQNDTLEDLLKNSVEEITCNGNSEKYATVQFLNVTFEELPESNVDDESKDMFNTTEALPSQNNTENCLAIEVEPVQKTNTAEEALSKNSQKETKLEGEKVNGIIEEDKKMADVTENFLENEKNYCQVESYLPLLSDIRFTGPAAEIMSTSFSQDSPTEPTSPECEQDNKPDIVGQIIKEWDSDSDSNSSNSSSGEFIWKRGGGGSGGAGSTGGERSEGGGEGAWEGSADSGSGSEGDEVEFVPSSWDCRAAPAKSSLRSLEQAPPDSKKRVVFKRQKYHCVYEYPREVADTEAHSPAAYLPDLSTYCEWDASNAEDAELGYGQLFGAPLDLYPLRAGIAFGADFDEDFFISSSARPFESLGLMSTTSQFFPGMHVKPSALLDRDPALPEDFPPPPSPLPTPVLSQTRAPSLDFTTPDSGVEDITPGSTSTEEDFKAKKLPDDGPCWRPVDSGSSSESVSPSSPGGEALGGLRHTRDKLKLDLPPSPHIPSPRHNRVFNFVLDKPKRHRIPDEKPAEIGTTPLVMTDETPIITTALALPKDSEDVDVPEPTFSTFGKSTQKNGDSEQKMILTDEVDESSEDVKEESPVKAVEPVKGEGTVLDSGDEDSGIESSSKATLERNKTVS